MARVWKMNSMHNLDEIIKIYFNFASVTDIFSGKIQAYHFPREEYAALAAAYLDFYSDTEQSNLYDYIQSSRDVVGHHYARKKGRSGLNVFVALEALAEELFVLEENEVKCRYKYLLRLRNVEEFVDTELLVASYLVAGEWNRQNYGILRKKYLMRNITVTHNNLQLKRMTEQGMAENHFHLYGSAPMFHLIWIQMMNDITFEQYDELFKEIDSRPRTVRWHYRNNYSENECVKKVLKAAILRFVLAGMLMGEKEQEFTPHEIRSLLTDRYSVRDYCGILQKKIRVLRAACRLKYGREIADYAMMKVDVVKEGESRFAGLSGEKDNKFAIFAGERWLLYELLKKEHAENDSGMGSGAKEHEWMQWFYAYLVIKNQIRNEILQTNSKLGFENFSIISHRKNVYSDYRTMAELAICGSLDNEKIDKFEVRISPADKAEKCALYLQELESFEPQRSDGKKAIFYVYHFPKKPDEEVRRYGERSRQKECRHSRFRRALERQANEIERFRDSYPRYAARVLGIDACAQEIGCRPEVFGPVFRRLARHTSAVISKKYEVPQLRMTYHVGEDFLDVADGLRAVEEAIRFLNLQCGSRIGHGTVLGISVEKWYQKKRNTIIISMQDYLDNVVWLYHKINEFRIEGCSQLLAFLRQEFEEMFYIIYRRNIDMEEVRSIWEESEKEYAKDGYKIKEFQYIFDIYTYYAAWKLRGDDPSLYQRGYYRENILASKRQEDLLNWNFPMPFECRKQRDVSILYYYYHFNHFIYKAGRQKIEKVLPDCYIEGVIKVQKAMRSFIGRTGIGIECNPSSNLKISTMESYEEHPVVSLYNKDLEKDPEKLYENPHLFVSINTDDKGVFRTSLENEYALMACAMEKIRDKQGNPVYDRQMIYQWLDNIRKMGLQQSFMGEERK